MSLRLHTGVISLFKIMLQIQSGSKVFVHNLDYDGRIATLLQDQQLLVSAISPRETPFVKFVESEKENNRYGSKYSSRQYSDAGKGEIEVSAHENLDMYKLTERFQYAFSLPMFHDSGKPLYVNDTLRQWHCSQFTSDHRVPAHLIAIEAMYNAVLPGGFFSAVMPRRWMGSMMRYMKWLNANIALVSKINLPKEALERWVITDDDLVDSEGHGVDEEIMTHLPEYCKRVQVTNPEGLSTGNWLLFTWQRPVEEGIKRTNKLYFGKFRYSSFVAKAANLDEQEVERICGAFRKSDWSKLSVRPYQNMLGDTSDAKYSVSSFDSAVLIRNPREIRVLKLSDKNKPDCQRAATTAEIKEDPLAAHVKLGPPVKVYTYSTLASGIMEMVREKSGYDKEELSKAAKDESYTALDNFSLALRLKSLGEQKEWLFKVLLDAGLHPYMTQSDYVRLQKRERWLNIQLAPIRRNIKVPSSDNGDTWEPIFDDVDIQAVYPEIWNEWVRRAKKMKLDHPKHSFTFPFQFEDIVTEACKQCILNGNHMGLGKTREALFLQLLKGVRHGLYVIPTRLIGVWQEEIETTIANFVRLVRRDWMGRQMDASVQVIQWGRDCLPHNLKTFNIISYENLPKTPKDAAFFQCPVCKFVVCSPFGITSKQACPKCNHRRTKNVQEQNRIQGLRKYRLSGEEMALQAASSCVVDTRLSSGNIVWMQQVDEVYDKVSVKQVGFQEVFIPSTGLKVKEPIFKEYDRKPHLAWSFSGILRNMFSFITIDESNYINNPKAQRSEGLFQLRARTRVSMTGTPVRGYPKSICNVLNWTFRNEVFPDYRGEGRRERGVAKFQRKYATFVQKEDGSEKLVPKINQPELFQQEIAPMMMRRLRHDPEVAKSIPPKTPIIDTKIIPMDPEHAEYYQRWLDVFTEWWAMKRLEVDKQENAAVTNDLLVKMGYLINASSIPHFMLDNLGSEEGMMWAKLIQPYTSKRLTQKFEYCKGMIEKNVRNGEKTIVFCWRRANLKLGKAWCNTHKPPIYSLLIDGSVSNQIQEATNRSKKQELVDKFRHQDYSVMWAGIQTMKEGFNIPEANNGIFMDYTWEPSDWQQGLARMLRPAQRNVVKGTFLCHEGTADEYVAALVQLKARSAEEGVDFQSYEDFSANDVPDFVQYANAIVDGKEKEFKQKMWTEVERLKRELEDE